MIYSYTIQPQKSKRISTISQTHNKLKVTSKQKLTFKSFLSFGN